MLGIIYSIVAGIAMSIQGVFNSRVSEKIGLWETNAFVQGSAFILSLIISLIWGRGNFKKILEVNKLYLLGGLFGIIITYTVMKSMLDLGPTYAVAIILVAQLLAAGIIDWFGFFDTKKIVFSINKIIGLIIMIVGIIIFKWKH
ncbi:DMT family transporter [Inconstantimicrobium mannanitabidum]|uniref:Membrane protein n=1 Tax=Inconstantimicrobium mannanitabidum TaxID=1604901 RepID=A0ACB5RH95_9CLOT|nr:DMT family transporter [Clostridium sp. TW13]GKX68475.1 membrane protein [Clostridium sp. TW13]